MAQIVNGLKLNEVIDGGAVFEVKHEGNSDTDETADEHEYVNAVTDYLKLECIDLGNEYEGSEPFESFAKKMENLLPDGKIKKRVLREGYGGTPEASSHVELHYNAYIEFEAQPFDSTYARKKRFSFTIGGEEIIEGLELAVRSMQLNEKSQFLIHPDLAYKSSGLKRIPENSMVLFEIELFDVKELVETDNSKENARDFKSVYTHCLGLCVRGKNMFRLKDYIGATREYNSAIHKLEEAVLEDYNEQLKYDELMVRLHTNLLVCNTHMGHPKKGCIHANKIYEMAKNKTVKVDAKVYFNHSKCLKLLGDYDRAKQKLFKAKKLEPRNAEILGEFLALQKTKEEYMKQQAKFARAFASGTN